MKNLFITLGICSLCMTACNNEMDSILPENNNNIQSRTISNYSADYQVIAHNGTLCLQFKNDSTYNETISKISTLPEQEANAMFAYLGFTNQQQIMAEADKEQEAIVDNYEQDVTQAFPEQQIKDFKQKYQDVFLFNPYDKTDFIANYKIKNSTQRFFTNREGFFMIGDSIVYAPQYTSEELFGNGITTYGKNEATDANSMNKAETKYQIPGGDYVKVRAIWSYSFVQDATTRINYQYINIEYLSQKKKVLWKKHHATITLKFQAKASGKGLEIYQVAIATDKPAWERVVNAQGLEWINVCDGLGQNSPVIGQYNLRKLPSCFLIVDGTLSDRVISDAKSLRQALNDLL